MSETKIENTPGEQSTEVAPTPQEPSHDAAESTVTDANALVDEPTEDTAPDSKESQKYRRRAQQAEAERDAISGQLADARSALVDAHLTTLKGFSAGVTRAQLEAGGYKTADLLDEGGHVDTAALDAAITDTQTKLGIQPTRLLIPREGESPRSSGGTTWSEALRSRN